MYLVLSTLGVLRKREERRTVQGFRCSSFFAAWKNTYPHVHKKKNPFVLRSSFLVRCIGNPHCQLFALQSGGNERRSKRAAKRGPGYRHDGRAHAGTGPARNTLRRVHGPAQSRRGQGDALRGRPFGPAVCPAPGHGQDAPGRWPGEHANPRSLALTLAARFADSAGDFTMRHSHVALALACIGQYSEQRVREPLGRSGSQQCGLLRGFLFTDEAREALAELAQRTAAVAAGSSRPQIVDGTGSLVPLSAAYGTAQALPAVSRRPLNGRRPWSAFSTCVPLRRHDDPRSRWAVAAALHRAAAPPDGMLRARHTAVSRYRETRSPGTKAKQEVPERRRVCDCPGRCLAGTKACNLSPISRRQWKRRSTP
jgi:hypothetical protein